MIRIYQVLFLFLIANYGIGQPADKLAENLRKEGQLTEAIEAYKATYSQSPDNWQNTYDLACAYALTYQTDSAFHYLNMAIKGEESLWPLADTDLLSLIDDPRWAGIEDYLINKYQEQNKKLKQPEYAKKLLRLIIKDQALDYYVDQAKAAYMKEGNIPHWYYPIGAYKQEIGQKNYEVMKELLEEYGWPKYSTVGELAADAPLLIINHHESESVRVQYLPQIKKACLENEGSCMEYAKIQDRILVNTNQPQIYGMQFRYNSERELEPFPIKDPEYVDQRRAEIGLEPLRDYLKRKINYEWTVEQKTDKK
jgi:hypothetical protein